MTGKLLVKGILVWMTSFLWCILLSVEGDKYMPIVTLFLITIFLSFICYKTVSYDEFKKVSGYSWLCKKLNIPEDEE